MMKTLVVLSCLFAAALAVTNLPLSNLASAMGGGQTITVTATFPDTAAQPVITTITYPTTYNAGAASPTVFVATGSGTSTGNNTVAIVTVSFTNGANTVFISLFPTYTSLTAFTLAGGGYPQCMNDGSYAPGGITILTNAYKQYTGVAATTALVAFTAQKYTPTTITALSIVTPQTAGCGAATCSGGYLNATATVTNKAGLAFTLLLRASTAATAVRFYTTGSSSAGAIDFNDDSNSLVCGVGGVVQGGFYDISSTTSASSLVVPKDNALTVSGFNSDTVFQTFFAETAFGGAGLQATVTLSSGGTDVTAPTCTIASFNPITVTTTDSLETSTLTLTCADEASGSGIASRGIFAQAAVTGGVTRAFAVSVGSGGTTSVGIPPYVAGTFNIIGAWAIDNAGNGALYGSCGGVESYDTVCGAGGGSSASTVSISLLSMAILAILALFA